MAARRDTSGFTTLELVISVAILGLVTFQIMAMVQTQQRHSVAHREVVDVQEDVRLVSDMMLGDVRMAGFMLPAFLGISSGDGGAGGPDRLCASDATLINPATLATATTRFNGAGLTAAVGAGATTLSVAAADLDIDGDGDDDFAVGSGLIASDGTNRSHCARITNIAGGTITFTPATPAGFSLAAGAGRAAPAIVYEVTGNGLERNTLLFSGQVEDLQVEFGVDVNGDGALTGAEFPVHDLNGSSPDDVKTLRISVVAQTTRDDLGFVGGGRPALGNRTAGAADTFRRRIATNTIAPRNLL